MNTGALSITEIIFARTSPIAEGSLLITSGPDGRNQSVFRGFDGTIFNPKWSVEANFVVAFETDVEDIIGFVVMDHTGRIISRQQGWNCELKIEECNLHALWPRHFEKNVYIASRGKLYEHVVETGKPTAGYLEPFDQLPSTGEIMGIDLIGDSNDYALATDMDGNWDIWRGLGFDKVTKTDSYEETYPRWSPDGKFIAFTTTRLGNKDIFLINLETGSFRQITNSQADDIQPTWSPDGTHIAFASNRNGNWDIFVASAEVGGEDKFLFQLTSSPEDDLHPDWRNYR